MEFKFTMTMGQTLVAASVPAGEIRAIRIDNTSGSWLYLPSLQEYVRPYTLAWGRILATWAASIDVQFATTGPDGSLSLLIGDDPIVTLADKATIDRGGGSSFANSDGQSFKPTTRVRVVTGTMPVAASLTNLAFTGTNVGRRIYSIQIDNPSQAWLSLATYGDLIPPNTVGWSKVLADGPSSVTITAAATGADGSPSVQLGDTPKVTLFDDFTAGNTAGAPYTPIVRKRVVTTAAFGNLGVTAFTGADAGRFVQGIIVDNPSGAWLSIVVGGATYLVAPYTLRWVKRIDPAAANVTSLTFAAAGPAGQISTRQGDQVTLTLLDQPPDVPDTSFIQGFTPISLASALVTVLASVGFGGVILANVANKRYRLRTVDVQFAPVNGNPPLNYDSGMQYQFSPIGSANAVVAGRVNLAHPLDQHTYPNGLDLAIGVGLRLDVTTDFATNFLSYAITYELV